MRVRIVKRLPRQLEGINLARFELGGVYEAGGAVLDLLIISGYAVPAEDAITAATPPAEDVTSQAEPDGLTSKQMLGKSRPRQSRALRRGRPGKVR
jgi:hypothetical protein